MDQAVTHAKAALEECIELRAEIERLRAALETIRDGTYDESITAWDYAAQALMSSKGE